MNGYGKWLTSPRYCDFLIAQFYYYNYTFIRQKHFITKVTDISERTNTQLACGLMGDVVNQRRDYLLSQPVVGLPTGVSQYELRRLAVDYILTGQMVVGVNSEGEFKRYAPEAVCPWDTSVWLGYNGTRIPLLTGNVDTFGPTFMYGGRDNLHIDEEPEWWTVLQSSDSADGIGLENSPVRRAIDTYELLLSRKNDVLADQPNAPLVVQGYLDNPDQFVNRVREDGVIFMAKDGSVEILEPKVDFDATDLQLERLLTEVYHSAYAVRPISDNIKSFDSSVALRLLYADIDARSRALGDALKEVVARAVEAGFLKGASGDVRENIHFTLSAIVNENDTVNNAAQSAAFLSREEILKHHPWVSDLEDELKRTPCAQENTTELENVKAANDRKAADSQRVMASRASKSE